MGFDGLTRRGLGRAFVDDGMTGFAGRTFTAAASLTRPWTIFFGFAASFRRDSAAAERVFAFLSFRRAGFVAEGDDEATRSSRRCTTGTCL